MDIDLSRAVWHKSTFSNGNGGACVESAALPGDGRAVRDSKDRGHGPVLYFTRDEWAVFLAGVKAGEFG